MEPLAKPLRRQLEDAVVKARDVAEEAARAALSHLGVGDADAPQHLTDEERALRRRLRIHGRQLGDKFLSPPAGSPGSGTAGEGRTGHQAIDKLVHETAYEHWHRMLFARFLAENGLLMHPDGVALTLDECHELARDEGAADGWELAGRYASRMLPQIFRPDSPVLALQFAPEHQRGLERLLAGLDPDCFQASDSLGWVYQFWQTRRKAEVNASEVKIGADELPAVTQLFTEPYMVAFLLDNAIGAWWAARRLSAGDLETADSEETLRRKAAIPGVPLAYLRFVQRDDGTWTPAAGRFETWPERLAELKTLDPCCGSGHFLVAALLMLVPMRMALEGLSAREAVDAVLRDNLHGLELDQRCVELAAFALALTAWTYPDAGGYRPLPSLNLACSGLSVSLAKEEWKQLGRGRKNFAIALDWLHDGFQDAPLLGSLLDPSLSDAAKLVHWEDLSAALDELLEKEPRMGTDGHGGGDAGGGAADAGRGAVELERQEGAVVAQGLARAASLLAGRYQWVITNVPYLARGKHHAQLRDFCERHYPAAKNDLATVFLERCLGLCVEGGTTSVVLPQNWLFLTSYRKLREKLLKQDTWHLIARLGPGAFETISGEVVKAILLSLSRGNPAMLAGGLFGDADANNLIRGLDVSDYRMASEKAEHLQAAEIKSVGQKKQLENPDARVTFDDVSLRRSLGDYCVSIEGLTTGDLERFVGKFWEGGFSDGWDHYIQSVDENTHHGGLTDRIYWENGNGSLSNFPKAHNFPSKIMNGKQILGKYGLRITQMQNFPITIYPGDVFGKNGATVVPDDLSQLPAIWCFCSSPEYSAAVREIDQSLKVTNATLVKVPFDLDYWTQVSAKKYPSGLPKPYTDDPTQWIFHGHPCGSVIWSEDRKWTAHGPLRTDETVLQVAVARLLGYRWPAELDPEMDLADEQRAWVARCESLLVHVDDDGILSIPPVRGEASAADCLLKLLAAAYGEAWSNDTLSALLRGVDHGGKTLESWLRDKFFVQHCRLFQQRPFIWHLWDGLRDGFAALVNYHRLDSQNLERLIYTYLGDWIRTQERAAAEGRQGADERLAAAKALKTKLEAILEGEAPLDIFVRWKPIERQPIGWEPDLNDGVRLNIRPFMLAGDVGRKGAGVLRDKPNIKWEKDRGKDVESAPWFPVFKGERINDHHLTLAEKRAARATTASSV